MSKIEWDSSLSVGVDLIDEQHKKWFEHLNDVALAVASHQGPTHVAKNLGFLIEYTDYHFGTEEKFMQEHEYPGYDDHKSEHEDLKRTLAGLVSDYEEDGPTHPLAESIDTFLGNWLRKHIKEIDVKLAMFLKDKDIPLT